MLKKCELEVKETCFRFTERQKNFKNATGGEIDYYYFDISIRIHIHFSPVVSRNSLFMVNAQVCLFKKRQCLSLITTNLTGGKAL